MGTKDTTMLMKKCPRCGQLMPYGPTYCTTCKPLAEAELEALRASNARKKEQAYNRRRNPKYRAFYTSKAWRTLSRAFLQAAGYKCQAHISEDCSGLAVEVHHIKPIQTPEGWELRLDWDNLEAVCTSCHNARHPEKLRRSTPEGVIDMRTLK